MCNTNRPTRKWTCQQIIGNLTIKIPLKRDASGPKVRLDEFWELWIHWEMNWQLLVCRKVIIRFHPFRYPCKPNLTFVLRSPPKSGKGINMIFSPFIGDIPININKSIQEASLYQRLDLHLFLKCLVVLQQCLISVSKEFHKPGPDIRIDLSENIFFALWIVNTII